MGTWNYIGVAAVAYLLGSIPTGYLVARTRGIDIRDAGSGNIGATNVFRVLGRNAGCLVLFVDGLKGFIAGWFLPALALAWSPAEQPIRNDEYVAILAGICAILGHNYTCWLKFKGGKGVATTAGVLLALFPAAFLVVIGVWAVVFVWSRYVSLASIAGAIALPVAAWLLGSKKIMLAVAVLMGGLAIYKHKGNIHRLLNGTENRFSRKKNPIDAAK